MALTLPSLLAHLHRHPPRAIHSWRLVAFRSMIYYHLRVFMAMSKGPGALLELAEDRHLASLVKDWDFSKGRAFEDAVFSSYMSSVHHPSSSPSGAFHLLAVFHRFTFWLTDASVSLVLHACLGGAPTGFHVEFLKDRHYRFSVASRKVGFAVSDLKRIITPHFDVYFHLWRDGGANWECELRLWKEEEAASWQTVLHRRNRHTSSSSCFLC
jgi:hypothetical protein